jgi:RNA polymerase sigma factor (sigma-70 family)
MKNEADAEDVAQETFVKAFRSLSSFRAEAKFSTWLISITLNEARNRLRKQSAIRLESLDWPADDNSGVSPALWCLFLRRSTRNATASGQFAMSFPIEPAFHPPESPGHLRQSSVSSAFSLRPPGPHGSPLQTKRSNQ